MQRHAQAAFPAQDSAKDRIGPAHSAPSATTATRLPARAIREFRDTTGARDSAMRQRASPRPAQTPALARPSALPPQDDRENENDRSQDARIGGCANTVPPSLASS